MPLLIDRRTFLGAAAATALLRGGDPQLQLALFSDPHIAADPNDEFRGFRPHQNLREAVEQARGAGTFDLALFNGDLARQAGNPGDYVQFTQLIAPLIEHTIIAGTLGNHDDREHAATAFAQFTGTRQPCPKKLVSTVDAGPLRIVLLDSLLATSLAAGQVGRSQREWLKSWLQAKSDKPVLVFVHHNPDADSDTALVDADRL
jgi:3',5'-cyclic AMP phosphodiesterase CpdA